MYGKYGSIAEHVRIHTSRTAPVTSHRHSLVYNTFSWHTCSNLSQATFQLNSVLFFPSIAPLGKKYTALCHGIPWSIDPLSAKTAEFRCPIEWKRWIACHVSAVVRLCPGYIALPLTCFIHQNSPQPVGIRRMDPWH